jgi:hypothetical protein
MVPGQTNGRLVSGTQAQMLYPLAIILVDIYPGLRWTEKELAHATKTFLGD